MICLRDREKALSAGWDLMLRGSSGLLGAQFFRRLSDRELQHIKGYPNAACVGVNSGRARREVRKRQARAA